MNTTLILNYLENLSSKQRENLTDIMQYIQAVVKNAVVASVFTLPGFTVEGLPICNLRVKGKKIIIRFFQTDVFAVCIEKMPEVKHGICSITVKNKEDIASEQMKALFNIVALSTRVDAAFIRSIQLRDYGYYDSKLLKSKKKKG